MCTRYRLNIMLHAPKKPPGTNATILSSCAFQAPNTSSASFTSNCTKWIKSSPTHPRRRYMRTCHHLNRTDEWRYIDNANYAATTPDIAWYSSAQHILYSSTPLPYRSREKRRSKRPQANTRQKHIIHKHKRNLHSALWDRCNSWDCHPRVRTSVLTYVASTSCSTRSRREKWRWGKIDIACWAHMLT